MAIRKPVEGADFEGRRRRMEGEREGNETPFRRQNGRGGEAGEFQFHFREDAAPSTRLDSRRPFVCRCTPAGVERGYMIVIGVLLVSRALFFFFFFFSPSRCNIDVGCGRIFDRFDSFDSFIEGGGIEFLSRLD